MLEYKSNIFGTGHWGRPHSYIYMPMYFKSEGSENNIQLPSASHPYTIYEQNQWHSSQSKSPMLCVTHDIRPKMKGK